MSRLFRDRLLVGLAPAEVSLVRMRGVWRARVIETHSIACDPAFGHEPWQEAVTALENVHLLERGNVTVILSNHFVRYAIVPWSDALTSPAEEDAYVRHHFTRVHGERAKAWSLRWSEAARGRPRLASAVDSTLIESIKGCFPLGGTGRLVSVQPYLMAAINRWRRAIPKSGAWLVLPEPERACVALHLNGGWRSVQNPKGSWLAALERERHSVEGELPELVLLAGALPPETLAAGWKLRELPVEEAIMGLRRGENH